jgi:hypothetical protein
LISAGAAGAAADVSKILYGKNRKSYQSPNAQYNFDIVLRVWALVRFAIFTIQILDTSAAGP